MEYQDFSKLLRENMELINLELTDRQVTQFYDYMNLLIQWNKKINLTAITEVKDIILKHFIDSLTIENKIEQNKKIADIGTGAGFPGIPLKIIKPENEFVLIDSLNKRINFLNEVIEKLGLKNISVIHSRAEEIGHNKEYREKFDIVTSRAVAKMNILLEYMLPLTKVGGHCICLKGPNIQTEIIESKNALNILGGEIKEIKQIELPGSDNKRTIIDVLSVKQLPNRYPRKAGTPTTLPL